ncbi:hypothetical protein V1477_006178 [Vespula maculifrons]|uniref:Maturase K n=1 Tax=Vespula maculifrons TaxID=7453 RepID=A0ABD2CKI1_VESMC
MHLWQVLPFLFVNPKIIQLRIYITPLPYKWLIVFVTFEKASLSNLRQHLTSNIERLGPTKDDQLSGHSSVAASQFLYTSGECLVKENLAHWSLIDQNDHSFSCERHLHKRLMHLWLWQVLSYLFGRLVVFEEPSLSNRRQHLIYNVGKIPIIFGGLDTLIVTERLGPTKDALLSRYSSVTASSFFYSFGRLSYSSEFSQILSSNFSFYNKKKLIEICKCCLLKESPVLWFLHRADSPELHLSSISFNLSADDNINIKSH